MNFKKILPHILAVIGFIVLSITYCSPVLQNKQINSNDPMQSYGASRESRDFKAKTGEWPWWTNSMFGGMPTQFVAGSYDNDIFAQIGNYTNFLPGYVTNFIFYCLLGFYILLIALECDILLAFLGAIAYAFFSYNILYLEAGHISKIAALAFAPIMIAGLIYAFKGRRILGSIIFALGLGFEINANHIQITYYTFMAIGIMLLFQLYYAIKENDLKNYFVTLLFLGVTGGLALGSNVARLWSNYDYSKDSIRGKSELTLDKTKPTEGLDKEYAFDWSYGKLESLSLLIPNFSGGASNGEFGEKSETYKKLASLGVPAESLEMAARSMPSYWGDQPFVAGPAYAGAIICFLFVLGLFISKNKWKLPFAIITLLMLIVAWGGNFFLNDIFFDYLPLFNKFRAVSMAVTLFQLFAVIVAAMGVKTLIDTTPTFESLKKPLLYSFLITGGISLIFAIMPSLFLDFRTTTDTEFLNQLKTNLGNNADAANQVYNSILDDRAGLLKSDALRSFIFILLSTIVVWLFSSKKINKNIFLGILTVLVLVDLWAIDKRYMNNDDFKSKQTENIDSLFQPTAADNQILQDKDPDFRVLNTTTSFWQDAKTSYFHKSVGGYSAAKLKIIQELFDNQMVKDGKFNLPIFNMLNTKYFIVGGQNGEIMAQRNPDAFGHAWFVNDIKFVKSANEEMTSLDKVDLKKTAVIRDKYSDLVTTKNTVADTTAKIILTKYEPNYLSYESDAKDNRTAVFSEIFYQANRDWISKIDGKEVPHFKADYVLRAMEVPSGKHKIEFVFKPTIIEKGYKIDLICSVLLCLVIVGGVFWEVKKK